jgi:hypothetical protein
MEQYTKRRALVKRQRLYHEKEMSTRTIAQEGLL